MHKYVIYLHTCRVDHLFKTLTSLNIVWMLMVCVCLVSSPVQDPPLPPIAETHQEVTGVSRVELLEIVRKQFGGGVPMDGRYWCELLDLFCVRGWGGSRHFDDALYFVPQSQPQPQSQSQPQGESAPFFTRPWGPNLSAVLGGEDGLWSSVDWRASFFLNLVCHTAFTLTVATATRAELDRHRLDPRTPINAMHKMTKRVYASPCRQRIDGKREGGSSDEGGAIDIYFATDEADDTFEQVVSSLSPQCCPPSPTHTAPPCCRA